MWAWLYLAIFAFATLWTYVWVIQKEAVFFTSLIAGCSWFFLALAGGTLDHVSGGTEVTVITTGGFQLFVAGLGVMSLLATLGAVMEFYPPEDENVTPNEFSDIR